MKKLLAFLVLAAACSCSITETSLVSYNQLPTCGESSCGITAIHSHFYFE